MVQHVLNESATAAAAYRAVTRLRFLWQVGESPGWFGVLILLSGVPEDPLLAPALPWMYVWAICGASFCCAAMWAYGRLKRWLPDGRRDVVGLLWLGATCFTLSGLLYVAAGVAFAFTDPVTAGGPGAPMALAVTAVVLTPAAFVPAAACIWVALHHRTGLCELVPRGEPGE